MVLIQDLEGQFAVLARRGTSEVEQVVGRGGATHRGGGGRGKVAEAKSERRGGERWALKRFCGVKKQMIPVLV